MEYNVVIIREAEQDMEDIYNYIGGKWISRLLGRKFVGYF